MIHTLKTTAVFPVSGATLVGHFQPQTGITAVVGENGAGKTFRTIEATRWLLFGKAALRGAASDYKQAEVTGTVEIRGAMYEISRGKHEWAKDGSGAVVAKGAEQVTAYVTSLFGYGLDVFDLCNAATQGNVSKLGDMRSGERKAIIDKVIRLTDAERAEKDCREEAKGYKREVEALTKMLRAPGDAPVMPADSRSPAELRASLNVERDRALKYLKLSGLIYRGMPPIAPMMPRVASADVEEMQAHENYRASHMRDSSRLNSITQRARRFVPNPIAEDQLVLAEQRNAVRRAIADRGPVPRYSRKELEKLWAEWAVFDAHDGSDEQEVNCPHCNTLFYLGHKAPDEPTVSKPTLRDDALRAGKHAAPEPELPDGPDMTPHEIEVMREHHRNVAEFDAAAAALAALPKLVDYSATLAAMRGAVPAWAVYDRDLADYEVRTAASEAAQHDLDELGYDPSSDQTEPLLAALSAAERYEADCRAYVLAEVTFKDMQAKIIEAQFLADEYAAGAKGIADARATVKALIAPKISRIATALIRDMSMGKLSNLIVDDEMEITVGGQRIETLSGAGKTVANLALRIAMGQALVGRVFPVFLADEIDGDLSATRRAATLQALVSLKSHLSQIILVTHRGADIADHIYPVSL